uniref:RNA-binding protein 25 n=3 Tax=Parascaris TaxID=6254 RepID=A0A915BZI4_PARUN
MALPPRFPGLIPAYGAMPLPPMAPIMSFPNPYFMPNPLMAAAAVNSQRMAAPAAPQPKPPEKPPVTTVFVGNITEKCGNELIRSILSECGAVATWKRIQGSNGKFQAFGFCEFESPFGTMRALRILHDYQLAEKKLVVKIDDKTRAMVKEYVAKKRAEKGLSAEVLAADEMPADEENAAEDEQVRQKIQTLIETDAPSLLPIEGQRTPEGELDEKTRSPGAEKSGGSLHDREREREKERERSERLEDRRRERKEDERRASRHRHRSRSRSGSRDAHRLRKRSRSDSDRSIAKRSRHHSSSSASSGSTSSSFSESSFSNRSGSHGRKAFRSHSPSRDRESEDSDEQRERRALRKQIREKEAAYAERLRKWEAREKRQAKLYEKDEQREKQRKRDTQKEAKKLKHFLEDYDDERNDPKYYKSSSLFQRRRDFEREREADAKDRQREQQEIEELKKQILAENENIENADEEARRRHQEQEDALMRKLRADSGSPNPHRPLGQKPAPPEEEREEEEEEEESDESDSDSDSEASADARSANEKVATQKPSAWKAVTSEGSVPGGNSPSISLAASPSIRSSSVASPAMLRTSGSAQEGNSAAKSSKLNGIFGFEDNDEDTAYRKGKKLKPFEITEEDRIQAMTPEERKQMIKDLIERIPTAKDELFAFPIHWNYVDKTLVDQRVKPWVSKKITDYIGEEEASLVDFVCEKVISKTDPQKILSDIAMVLDDEAEVFVVKMWRLLIYESEARKLGLSKK